MRFLVVVGVALVLVVSGGIGLSRDPVPTAGVGTVAGTVVVPGAARDLDRTLESLQATLRRVPADHHSWAALGLAYVEQARVTGDPGYYAKAEAAVDRSLRLEPGNFAALSSDAALHAARHRFGAALDLADRALEINSHDLTALAIRVDALTELGRYADQMDALSVADRRRPGIAVATRYAYAYELRGDLARAAQILERAAQSGTPDDRAHLFTLLADIERRQSELDAAAAHLERARRESPGYLPALVSQARLDVALGDLTGAVQSWRAVTTRLPLPEYLVELGELYLHLDRPEQAAEQFAVVETTMRLLESGGSNTDLEAALYRADHGDARRAVTDAQAEWDRRNSIHAADALGWALHRVGRDAEALELARKATRLGTPEARLWIHRGSIEAALGMDSAARTHLRRGLASDPGLSPWQAAQAHAVLEDLGGTR